MATTLVAADVPRSRIRSLSQQACDAHSIERVGRPSRRAALIFGLLSGLVPMASHSQVLTPERGSSLRAQIVDGLRPTVQSQIGGNIEFVIGEIRVLNDWAYISAKPQRPGGGRIDWSSTKFREAWGSDTMSELVLGLLRRDGAEWQVVEYAIGPTDVIWEEWIRLHRLPRQLFAD